MNDRKRYETQFWEYLKLAEQDDLTKMHATALQRRQLYAKLAELYYKMWHDAPAMVDYDGTMVVSRPPAKPPRC